MASKQVCQIFPELFREGVSKLQKHDLSNEDLQKKFLNNILKKTEEELDKVVLAHPEFRGMATTMTFLNITDQSVIIAWAGDSRVYHFGANGKIKDVTTDHSLVQALFEKGEIEEHEIATHPRRNVILRAVSGTESRTKLDVKIIPPSKIEQGDIFFMTTDGVLEAYSDDDLETLFGSGLTDLQIKNQMKLKCGEKSKDNFSMYFFRVESIDLAPVESVKAYPEAAGAAALATSDAATITPGDETFKPEVKIAGSNKTNPMWYVFLPMFFLLCGLGGYYLYQQFGQPKGWETKKEEFIKGFDEKLNNSKTIKEKLELFSGLKKDSKYIKLQEEREVGIDSIYSTKKNELKSDRDRLKASVKSNNNLIENRIKAINELKDEANESDALKTIEKERDSLITLNKNDCERLGNYQVCLDFKNLISPPEAEEEVSEVKEVEPELSSLGEGDKKKKPKPVVVPPTTTKKVTERATKEDCEKLRKNYLDGACYDDINYINFNGDTKGVAIVKHKIEGKWKWGYYKKQEDGSYKGNPTIKSQAAFNEIYPFVETLPGEPSRTFARVKRGNRFQFINLYGIVLKNKHPQYSDFYKKAQDFELCNSKWYAKVTTQEDNKEYYFSTSFWLNRDCEETPE